MSAEERIKEVLGEAKSPSWMFGHARSGAMEAGTPEARLTALETDVGTLREALLVAAREIDHLG